MGWKTDGDFFPEIVEVHGGKKIAVRSPRAWYEILEV